MFKPAGQHIAPAPPELQEIELPPELPGWRSRLAHHTFSQYRRLAALVGVINLIVLTLGLTRWGWWSTAGINLVGIANVVILNIGVAILIRQQLVINLLFKIATSVPTHWPLRIRWAAGKVFHFGGIHSGGAVAGTLWFLILGASMVYQWANQLPGISMQTLLVTALIFALLVTLVLFALPGPRAKYHNRFEAIHRLGGWSSLLLFWLFLVLFTRDQGGDLFRSLAFVVLSLVTVSVILPWLHLKKVPVRIVRPSNHVALAHFDYGVTPFAGSSTALSRNPLLEWHSFANVPAPGQSGFRLTISRAGDWTGQFIDDMPSHIWVKGIPTAGVGNVDQLFKRVVWIATGSGIGPTLPHLLAQEVPARLVWSTRNARKTYGDDLVEEILAVEPDALIWNTDERGRPDLVKLAYQAVVAFDAEAVIVISNQKLTRRVVYGMESRGIPAYGAIWDS